MRLSFVLGPGSSRLGGLQFANSRKIVPFGAVPARPTYRPMCEPGTGGQPRGLARPGTACYSRASPLDAIAREQRWSMVRRCWIRDTDLWGNGICGNTVSRAITDVLTRPHQRCRAEARSLYTARCALAALSHCSHLYRSIVPTGERAGRGALPLTHARSATSARTFSYELHVARRHRPLQLRHLVERRARSLTLSGQPTGGARGGVPVEPLRLWMGKVPPYPGEVKRLKDEEE